MHGSVCACAALLMLAGCQNVPKYKKASGKFDEWRMYEGKDFKPLSGIDTAVDTTAQTITIHRGTAAKVYLVTPDTRIMFNGDDITLAQLPLNEEIRFHTADDHLHLTTVWYGTETNTMHANTGTLRGY